MPDDERFDPLAEAERQWRDHDLGEPRAMHGAVSIIHAHQLVTTAIDRALKPLALTFARYEVLMLLTFSSTGALPMTKIGERLLVHPTGITRLVDKLEVKELVRREPHPDDRRSMLVTITPQGRRLGARATEVLADIHFGVGLHGRDLDKLIGLLDRLREGTSDDG